MNATLTAVYQTACFFVIYAFFGWCLEVVYQAVEHGKFIKKGNFLMMPMFHPAAILRNPNQKPEAFDDFLKLRDKINEICPQTYDSIC